MKGDGSCILFNQPTTEQSMHGTSLVKRLSMPPLPMPLHLQLAESTKLRSHVLPPLPITMITTDGWFLRVSYPDPDVASLGLYADCQHISGNVLGRNCSGPHSLCSLPWMGSSRENAAAWMAKDPVQRNGMHAAHAQSSSLGTGFGGEPKWVTQFFFSLFIITSIWFLWKLLWWLVSGFCLIFNGFELHWGRKLDDSQTVWSYIDMAFRCWITIIPQLSALNNSAIALTQTYSWWCTCDLVHRHTHTHTRTYTHTYTYT